MMATVVLNLSGLLNGFLQLFLRSNTATTSFGPRGRSWHSHKHEIRIWGPNELAFHNQMVDPVPAPSPASPRLELKSRAGSQKRLVTSSDKGDVVSMTELPILPQSSYSPRKLNHLGSNSINSISSTSSPRTPTEHLTSEQTKKQSYSLFPQPGLESPSTLLPPQMNRSALESVYDISDLSDLAPPPPLHGRMDHTRDSSVSSSATVQIGIRLSHAPTPPPVLDVIPPGLPSTTYTAAGLPAKTFQAPTLPPAAYTPTAYTPTSEVHPAPNKPPSLSRIPPSPAQSTYLTKNSIPIPPRSPFRSPPTAIKGHAQQQQSPTRLAVPHPTLPQKSLPAIPKPLPPTPPPPTPKQLAIQSLAQPDAMIQLSPTVYTPPEGSLQINGLKRSIPTRSESIRRNSRLGPNSQDHWV
ncbi:hypothetical protein DSL72_008889 [Monilinia vaccinii-corymbosi]|uniref:Uncharacterized protein n=1 Tax=Monilinia vaccinii-corymbosi TaxID=61207 RepID=A0A8A3PRK7_9HELO|nr:hypothetical protein DSL72_008889 [Monilinia vaccinii-corymbosi]